MDNNKLASIPRRPQAKTELRIESVQYPHIAAGEYHGYVSKARVYYDGGFKRNVCCILFDILDDSVGDVLAEEVPMWLNLGNCKGHVQIGRRSRYRQLWEQANG